jgi:hypothetical protein
MDSSFLKEQADRCRRLAENADQFTKRRLLDLAENYDARLGHHRAVRALSEYPAAFLKRGCSTRGPRAPDCQALAGGSFPRCNQRFRSQHSENHTLMPLPTGGVMVGGLGKRRLIGGAVVSLVIT